MQTEAGWGTCSKETSLKTQEDNIKVELKKGQDGVDWINVAQDRDKWWTPVNMVMNPFMPNEQENLGGKKVAVTIADHWALIRRNTSRL